MLNVQIVEKYHKSMFEQEVSVLMGEGFEVVNFHYFPKLDMYQALMVRKD